MAFTELLEGTSEDGDALRHLDKVHVDHPLNGKPALKIACRAIFFFDGGGTVEKRLAAFGILADYALRYREHLSHVQHAAKGRPKIVLIDWDTLKSDGEARIAELPAEKACDIGLFGPPFNLDNGGIAQFGGSISAYKPDELMRTDISYLNFSISHTALVDDGFGDFIALVRDACERLKPLHGLAGPSIQFDRIYQSTAAEVYAFPLLKRFPGLHCSLDNAFVVKAQGTSNDQIFTTNWLTVLSDRVLARSTDAAAAVTALPADTCPVHRYDGGLLIQAGPHPQLGDVNRGLVLDDYRRVAQAVKPLRFEEYRLGILPVEAPLDSLEETLKWIRRFD